MPIGEDMVRVGWSVFAAAAALVLGAQAAHAHFLELLPSAYIVAADSDRTVTLDMVFTHPMEGGPTMDMGPPVQFGVLSNGRKTDLRTALAGKSVLIVDDDIRNIFSLASVLEAHDMRVLHAGTGREGIDQLKRHPDVDVVLVAIMMPEMDGYQTMRAIRAMAELDGLPVIAVTAKAMKGDREKCIEAGATDYIPKPVDIDHLLSLLRVWTADRVLLPGRPA